MLKNPELKKWSLPKLWKSLEQFIWSNEGWQAISILYGAWNFVTRQQTTSVLTQTLEDQNFLAYVNHYPVKYFTPHCWHTFDLLKWQTSNVKKNISHGRRMFILLVCVTVTQNYQNMLNSRTCRTKDCEHVCPTFYCGSVSRNRKMK